MRPNHPPSSTKYSNGNRGLRTSAMLQENVADADRLVRRRSPSKQETRKVLVVREETISDVTRSGQPTMKPIRKRLRWTRLLVTAGVLVFGYLCLFQAIYFNVISDNAIPSPGSNRRKLLQSTTLKSPSATESGSVYPQDIFSLEQRKQGAVILHVLGMIYMFVALAIVCDEFFVPSLEVIITKMDISEDVAGATFMAAGGSAPELFTSIFGVFLSKTNVGIGTIVGSAVFNILFVIGVCAVASKTLLHLTWWPLFRDVTFYSIDLICLICCFLDKMVYWYESLILLLLYLLYVIFMKFNHKIETFVKSCVRRNQVTTVEKQNGLITNNNGQVINQTSSPVQPTEKKTGSSLSVLRGASSRFRQGVLQLLIHTIDPIADARVQDKAVKLHAIASLKVLIEGDHCGGNTKTRYMSSESVTVNGGTVATISNGQVTKVTRNGSTETTFTAVGSVENNSDSRHDSVVVKTTNIDMTGDDASSPDNSDTKSQKDGWDEESEPLDLSWPDKWHKRITYILVAPIVFLLWVTLPDVRRPEKRKWFPCTFIGSILWIAGFSYLMVWWASQTGETIGISDEIMGLTILAAGTSIPDLITSVIVARKGFGDMAVSSSVGSNIFDVTVGLPFPWLMYCAVFVTAGKEVDSSGLFCSILLLFMMLIFVITAIAISKWRMSKATGISMLVLYVVFVILSVLLQLGIIQCPVNT